MSVGEPWVNVEVENFGGFNIAVVQMNRPKKLNAWGSEMQAAVMGTLASLGQDETVHAAIITGSGTGVWTCFFGFTKIVQNLDFALAIQEREDITVQVPIFRP